MFTVVGGVINVSLSFLLQILVDVINHLLERVSVLHIVTSAASRGRKSGLEVRLDAVMNGSRM